ncbi:MAG: exodeoxyribonuclease VII large subunit, partial [Chloroflexi bacterium]
MQRQLSFWQATRRFTVSQITHYLKELIDTDATLRDVWVEGEVSNYSSSAAGHMYFSLKDGEALLPCVMWRSQARKLSFIPSDGDHVLAHGYISVYTAGGRYQFYVDAIQPIGLGLLYVELEQLKARLAAEGIFDQARKRPIPPFPSRIGVVTSPFGAAIRDIIRVLGRRFPLAEVILSPTLVQGQEAPSQIVAAMELLNDYGQVDLIILARGGGSFEELMA